MSGWIRRAISRLADRETTDPLVQLGSLEGDFNLSVARMRAAIHQSRLGRHQTSDSTRLERELANANVDDFVGGF